MDIWAPGEEIISAWIDNPDSLRALSGTSMATAHATGVAALLAGRQETKPTHLKLEMIKMAAIRFRADDDPSLPLLYNGGENISKSLSDQS